MFALRLVGAKVIWGIKLLATARVFAFPGPVGELDASGFIFAAFLVPICPDLYSAGTGLYSARTVLFAARTVSNPWIFSVLFVFGFSLFAMPGFDVTNCTFHDAFGLCPVNVISNHLNRHSDRQGQRAEQVPTLVVR